MDVSTRGFLYKTFIRPILHYGLENCDLNTNELDLIKTGEGNIIKTMIGINKQVHSTSLLAALNIEQSRDRLIQEKLSFFIRLYNNDYTRNVLIELAHANGFNSFQVEICSLLGIQYTEDTHSLVNKANHQIFILECKHILERIS